VLRVKKSGIDWELVPDFQPLLDRILADTGTVIKKTPTKLVTRHDFTGRPIYLKRYLNAVGLRPLKYYFKQSEARNEWGLAEEVSKRGIPVVRHLAFGERWTKFGCQESLIITEGYDGIRLDKFEAKHADELQAALAKLLRQMHDTGVLQRDLHHNILVKPQPLELCRIDVDRGEMKGPLSEAERVENLAYIHVFVPLLDKFFETYRATSEFRARIMARSAVIKREVAARRAVRCLERNLRFEPKQLGGLKWWVRLEFFDDRLKKLLENPDAALETCPHLFKTGPNRQATVGAFDGVVLKRFNQKNKANYFKDIFRPSRAYRAYQKAYHLELLDISTPHPIAAAERRCCRVVLNSYLVTEEIPDAVDLRSAEKLDLEIACRAGRLIGQLHANGFAHGDLKETNIVWDATGKVYILDLDGLDYMRQVSPERAAEDLQRLARGATQSKLVTDAHRQAFLQGYSAARGVTDIPRCDTPSP
jgi:tRNA A-37 threonylcarbamoyl transferase component Bud32